MQFSKCVFSSLCTPSLYSVCYHFQEALPDNLNTSKMNGWTKWSKIRCSIKTHVDIRIPSTLECDLTWGQSLYRVKQVQMKSLEQVLVQQDQCPCKKGKTWTQASPEGRQSENPKRRWVSLSQGERPLTAFSVTALRRNLPHSCLDPRLLVLQNSGTIHFCCSNYPVCGTLLQPSMQTKTSIQVFCPLLRKSRQKVVCNGLVALLGKIDSIRTHI